jgi:hypothetical protein
MFAEWLFKTLTSFVNKMQKLFLVLLMGLSYLRFCRDALRGILNLKKEDLKKIQSHQA